MATKAIIAKVSATPEWAKRQAAILAAARASGAHGVSAIMSTALDQIVRQADGHVPKYKAGVQPPFPRPEWHGQKPQLIDDDEWLKPWASRAMGANQFGDVSDEHAFLARMLATLNEAYGLGIPFPSNGHLAEMYKQEQPKQFTGKGNTQYVGCFSVSHLDAETAYEKKLLILPIGKIDGHFRYLRWKWTGTDEGHWVHNAWVVRRDGGVRAVPGNVHGRSGDDAPTGRAPGARGHGYWLDVEWGTNHYTVDSAPWRTSGLVGALPELFVSGANPNVPMHDEAVAHSRSFLIEGNIAYLPITKVAGIIYQLCEQAKAGQAQVQSTAPVQARMTGAESASASVSGSA